MGAAGEGAGKAEGGVAAAAVRHGAGACSWGGGGGAEGGADPDHVLYLQAAAVCSLHSALSAQRHVALNMGVKETTLTELKGLLDKHPVAHLLDPKRRRAEEGEGSQGSKRSRK